MYGKKLASLLLIVVLLVPVLAADGDADRERQKRELMDRINQEVAKFKSQCMADPDSCDCGLVAAQKPSCSGAPDADGVSQCERQVDSGFNQCVEAYNAGRKAGEAQRHALEKECRKDFTKCDCAQITVKKYKEECKTALETAKREMNAQRDQMRAACRSDPTTCSCETIDNEQGQAECESERAAGFAQRDKMIEMCKQDLGACDCSTVDNEAGRKECETKRANALKQKDEQILKMILSCWDDVRSCPCETIPDEPVKAYCITQRTYGVNCLDYGMDCEKIDEASFTSAPGVPEFLKPFFQRTIRDYIKDLRGQSLNNARQTIQTCVMDPENCDCSGISKQAVPFCEEKKDLGTRCKRKDYTACMQLDKTPRLPPGIPEFSQGPLESVVESFVSLQKSIILSVAAPMVGDTVLKCARSPNECDCSVAPEGEFRDFCEYKKALAISCEIEYQYEACFTLVNEPLLPEGTPGIIASYVETDTRPKYEAVVQEVYDRIRPSACAGLSLQECGRSLGYG